MMRGSFVNDQFHTGELQDEQGNSFTSERQPDGDGSGYFQNDRLCGFGRCQYSGGDRYQGFFQGGKRSGRGTMIFAQFDQLL
jgi:hypothetical protein